MTDPNVESVRAKLLERSKVGIKKYGCTTAGAGLDRLEWIKHLREELLDAAVYLEAMMNMEAKPTPKTVEVEGYFWETEDRKIFNTHDNCKNIVSAVPATAVITIQDTPKEPEERREFKSWIKDTDDRAFPFRSQKSAERWKQDGYRLATLVEKGGGE